MKFTGMSLDVPNPNKFAIRALINTAGANRRSPKRGKDGGDMAKAAFGVKEKTYRNGSSCCCLSQNGYGKSGTSRAMGLSRNNLEHASAVSVDLLFVGVAWGYF